MVILSFPYTLGEYMSTQFGRKVDPNGPEFVKTVDEVKALTNKLLSINGTRTVDSYHRELGMIMWDECGMARHKKGLEGAIERIAALRADFWKNVRVLGEGDCMNQSLEKAGRVADFLEFGELMCRDALEREESCGGHFRTEYQTPDGEALRNDEEYSFVSCWKSEGGDKVPSLVKESLNYEFIKPSTRSYK
jgi:succinate dehydrogenase / fumarate reductase, flavoprotein subunit